MTWRLLYHSDVEKVDLPQIPGNIRLRIKRAIELRLLQNPILAGIPLKKSLRGHRKLRVGDYRIIYRISGFDVIILIIGHRKEVYEQVLRRT